MFKKVTFTNGDQFLIYKGKVMRTTNGLQHFTGQHIDLNSIIKGNRLHFIGFYNINEYTGIIDHVENVRN